jgi:hypothetical protein
MINHDTLLDLGGSLFSELAMQCGLSICASALKDDSGYVIYRFSNGSESSGCV